MNKMKPRVLLAGLLLAAWGVAAAAPISGSPTGLASPELTITFDEHILTPGDVLTNQYADLGLTFTPNLFYSCQEGFDNITGNTATSFGCFGSGGDRVFSFSLKFSVDQTAAAFAMVSNDSVWTFEALDDGVVVESFNANAFFDTNGPNNFFGFTGIMFDEIRITSPDEDSMILDNVQLSSVPEPGALALLGIAFAGFAASRRRRAT